jgi:hypothetical protein
MCNNAASIDIQQQPVLSIVGRLRLYQKCVPESYWRWGRGTDT